jgi:hypothetical protein
MADKKEKTALEELQSFDWIDVIIDKNHSFLLATIKNLILEHDNKIYVMQGTIEDMELEIRTMKNQLGRL